LQNIDQLKYRNALLIVFLVILADQVLKIYIKTHFANGDDVRLLGSWCRLHFIENEGMAYGMKLSESPIGKIVLSSFRLLAVIFGFYLLKKIIIKGYSRGMIICGALILAGALGNLLDSMFYGLIFSDSPYSCFSGNYDNLHNMIQTHNQTAVAHLTSFGHGYGKFLTGKVVDMLYFPIVETTMPHWVPFIGSKSFIFFEPVFNIADAAISVGVITLLIFQKRLLNKQAEDNTVAAESTNV
jgi:signal peptidase II